MKRTLITSALPYANGYIHLGHCAGAYLPADIYARHKRLKGEEVLWVCGSDEHGVAITIAADKEKVAPQAIIDKYHEANKEAFHKFGITFDIYSRTSLPEHHKTAKEFFAAMLKSGYLQEKEENQFYDEKAQMFLPDRYVEGICPNCGADHARGDQCDSCGAYYNQTELKEPKSLVSGMTPIVKKTTHWYMKFQDFQDFLEKYIEGKSKIWKENVLQQTRSWLKQGLAERAITRDLNWGVTIDDIDGISAEKSFGKVLYVWFEAVLGYISATKHWASEINKEDPDKTVEKWWKDPDTRYVAFIGKDNIVFHALIFPALLHAKNESYILPDNIPANEFLNLEGQKFSKSRNWSIDLKDYLEDFPKGNFIDSLRYTLAMNFPETKDADFTWKDFQARNNNELAAILGNFVNRTLLFLHKNYDGKVPQLSEKYKAFPEQWRKLVTLIDKDPSAAIDFSEFNTLSDNDLYIIKALANGRNKAAELYERFRFRDALTETMNIARASNKYFNDETPWKTAKFDPEQCAKTMFVCSQLVFSMAVLFAPILPNSSKAIYDTVNLTPETGEPKVKQIVSNIWYDSAMPMLNEGADLKKPSILFEKIEDTAVAEQQSKLGQGATQTVETEAEPEKFELITIDDFSKVKLRTARILEAENIKKSKKLIKLQIDLGSEKRQIIAGIAEHYKPEQLIGKIVIVVANLQPAKLMGRESQGMLLAANAPDGTLSLATIEDPNIPLSAEVR